MNNIKTFFSAFYDLNKRDFWFLVFITIAMGIIVNFYPFHAFVKTGIIIINAGYIFNFMRSASVLPSVSSDFDRYSWKYFQGLPLSKRELLISLVLTDLLIMFPSLVWLMAFFKQLSGLFTNSPAEIAWAVKIFFFLIPILISISFSSIKNNITFPRKQYSKVDPRIAFFNLVKRVSIYAVVLVYAALILDYGSEYITWDPKPLFAWIWKYFPPLHAWYLIPVLFLGVVRQYFSTLKEWQNEKSSYIKIDWQPKRDFSIIAVCFVLVWVPIKFSDIDTPDEYKNGAYVNAVYEMDYERLHALLAKSEDINKPNEFGFTPLIVAARRGDFYTFKWLEKNGAKIQGVTKKANNRDQTGLTVFLAAVKGGNQDLVEYLLNKGANPNEMNQETKSFAIHYAAKGCKTKVLDLLLEKKADLNVLNKNKQSALHVAAYDKCFTSVALLLDAGINPALADNDSKTALQYVKQNTSASKELAFYLDKRSRRPAGK